MTAQSNPQPQNSVWADENIGMTLRLRVKTFYNADYFEHIEEKLQALGVKIERVSE